MARERALNRRQQGDLGEASAIDWLTRAGATVFTPIGHSPNVDLIALHEATVWRIQVKTTTYKRAVISGPRWIAAVCTRGGNRSWGGIAKRLDPAAIDYLFVLVGDGRRWFIPAGALDARAGVTLGGSKYAEFEIEETEPIEHIVHPETPLLDSSSAWGSAGAGEPGRTVNSVPRAE